MLGLDRVVELREGVVGLNEAEAALLHLPGEPVVTIDVDLRGEREEALQTDVDQAELGIDEIEVEDTLRALAEGEARPVLAVQQLDGAAGFHATEDGDEAVVVGALTQELSNQLLLVVLALQELVRHAGLLRQLLAMLDEALGLLLDERQEILAFELEGVIDEAVEVVVTAEGKMAMKNDSIMAGEGGYNGRRESLDEAVHGVLLQRVVWQHPLERKTPFLLTPQSLRLRR